MQIRIFAQAAAFAVILSAGAFAQTTSVQFNGMKSDPTLPVELTSDLLEVNQADGTAIFSGNAVKNGILPSSCRRRRSTA